MDNEKEEYYALLRLADSDLDQASHCLEAVENIDDRSIKMALTCHAIICYCRPFTSNRGKHTKGPLRVKKEVLTEIESSTHEKIMDARDQIIAHTDVSWRDPQLSKYNYPSGTGSVMSFKGFYYEHAIELGELLKSILPSVKKAISEEQIKCHADI